MPPEPKKPIEELLEASARARRAEFDGDPKMPNPMRARLQDEVARMTRSRERKSSWFSLSWPRLAIGAAFACLLVGTTVIWWREHQGAEAGAPLAMAKTAPAAEMNRAENADRRDTLIAQQTPTESDKLEAAPPASMTDSDQTRELAKAAPEKESVLQDFRQSTASPAIVSAGSVAQKRDRAMANLTQQFSQSAANKMAGSSARVQQTPKFLDNFQVEQNGRDFRVVDDDGSTYAGRIERLTANDTRNFLKEKQSYSAPAAPMAEKRAAAAEPASNNEFYFRATGYNASLKKSLVFEGNYIVTASPGKDQDAATEKKTEQTAARIVGTAKVPGEPPVEVDAVTVPAK